MSIHCRICNQEFQKLITSTHLKKHGMLTAEYIELYGKDSLASDEYRKEKSEKSAGINNPNYGKKLSDEAKKSISVKNKGKTAWNKGETYTDTTIQKDAAKRREERYKTGELKRHSITHSLETRNKISKSVEKYAKSHTAELKARSLKAIQTKKDNNYDFAFFRGHTHTQETKDLISLRSSETARLRREKSVDDMKVRLGHLGFTVVETDNTSLTAECNACGTSVTYTKQMFQPSKIREDLCPTCHPRVQNRSAAEIELFDFVSSLVAAEHSKKFDGTRRTIDIFVPSLNLGIEYNGLFYHSEQWLESIGNSKTKDFEKLNDANRLGIRLIQIFEDEWINKKDIVKSRIKHILGSHKVSTTIYARKCTVREISSRTASEFCNKHHIQGAGRSNIRLGLFYNEELISVMTFSKDNLSRKVSTWELNRFCSVDCNIPGGASKLFSHFVKKYKPENIITYADRRWSNGDLYKALGFVFDKYTTPGYWYLKDNFVGRIHRFSLRKTENDPVNITERQIRAQEGYKTIWDSGNSKWVWSQLQENTNV